MARDRSLVRASDVGSWLFCNRAWWLARVRKATHENPEALRYGNRAHADHGRQVVRVDQLRQVGVLLILGGLLLAGLLFLTTFL